MAVGRDGLVTLGPVCLAGHCEGGQLSAFYRTRESVVHAMPISAWVDLEPIAMSWLNVKLRLTQAETSPYGPVRHICKGVPVTVGMAELPELVSHSEEYAAASG